MGHDHKERIDAITAKLAKSMAVVDPTVKEVVEELQHLSGQMSTPAPTTPPTKNRPPKPAPKPAVMAKGKGR